MLLTPEQINSIAPLAQKAGIDLVALLALIEVESEGRLFANMNGAPVIRWEGHYFYRLTSGEKRVAAVKAGLAAPKAGAIKNPADQRDRYRMLARAEQIDEEAAFGSISIGVGQVMGANAKTLGYSSPTAMFNRAMEGLAGQVEIMIAYLLANDLVDELARKDWSSLARAYNGPAYRKNKYDERLRDAYGEIAARLSPAATTAPAPASGMLRLGSSGALVREAQATLVKLGYALKVDGDFGPSTKIAVKLFQRSSNLTVDGVIGPETYEALQAFGVSTDPLTLTSTPEAKTGAVGAGGGVGLAVIADKLKEIATSIGGDENFQTIATVLQIVAGAIVVGGMLWAAYGYLKSRKTREGLA